MAIIRKEYRATVKEFSIDCCGLSFLAICGKHINGAYVAFPGYGVSAELSESDVYYNTTSIMTALQLSDADVLPESPDGLEKLAKELSVVITPMLND